ncbi:MAG TPA: MFS transporter [Angustibacter sp.]|nr:MFS transporter [Angustibacter sp.]
MREHAGWSPWRTIVGFGVVSLLADVVYEGARSITGPLLASLGATAVVVGVVTGAGEAAALVLRLVFGPLADRTHRYWAIAIAGYALTAVSVPLLAVTPFVGGAGLALACVLVLAERTGKAVRSPAKSTLLADAAGHVGMGRGLGVHKALDQLGAFVGPLLVSGVIAVTAAIWPAMLALAVPGIAAVALLGWMRARLDGSRRGAAEPAAADAGADVPRARLPRAFYLFAASAGAVSAGLVTFGLISFHLATQHLVSVAVVPVVYAAAMGAEALAALATGYLYDRHGARVLVVLPVLVAVVPLLAFRGVVGVVVLGVVVWGAATGLQDSTAKALVADLVDRGRRASAYGVFAAIQGGAAVAGGAVAGALYERSLGALAVVVAITQAIALVLLLASLRAHASHS